MTRSRTKSRVMIVDDDELIASMLARALKGEGHETQVVNSAEAVIGRARGFQPDVLLLDVNMPGRTGLDVLAEVMEESDPPQVVMLTADDSAATAVRAMKLGALDYLTKPFDLDEVKVVVAKAIDQRSLREEVDYLRRVNAELVERPVIGESAAIEGLREEAAAIAEAGVNTILITGESGTGKEVYARYIHEMMKQSRGLEYMPFVGINCAAMPENLVESELFGHERGAFTDARAEKKGLFEMARGGSILLDEIGDMPLYLQSKLLRVLEERHVRRIGGSEDVPIDVIVFATTNKDLEGAVDDGAFRSDLYYRLSAFPFHIPPLRERREDIPVLARHFLERLLAKYRRSGPSGIDVAAEQLLRRYDWPGNVRELRNVMERIVVLGRGASVLPEHLPREIAAGKAPASLRSGTPAESGITIPDEGLSLEKLERELIVQALEKAGGNKTVAAKLLDVSYDSLRYQIKKFGLE